MAIKSLREDEIRRIPYFDRLILAARGYELVVGRDSDHIDVLLMAHYSHTCRVHLLFLCESGFLQRLQVPDFDRVVLAGRDKEVRFLGCKANTRHVFIVTSKDSHTGEGLLVLEGPQPHSVIFRSRKEK